MKRIHRMFHITQKQAIGRSILRVPSQLEIPEIFMQQEPTEDLVNYLKILVCCDLPNWMYSGLAAVKQLIYLSQFKQCFLYIFSIMNSISYSESMQCIYLSSSPQLAQVLSYYLSQSVFMQDIEILELILQTLANFSTFSSMSPNFEQINYLLLSFQNKKLQNEIQHWLFNLAAEPDYCDQIARLTPLICKFEGDYTRYLMLKLIKFSKIPVTQEIFDFSVKNCFYSVVEGADFNQFVNARNIQIVFGKYIKETWAYNTENDENVAKNQVFNKLADLDQNIVQIMTENNIFTMLVIDFMHSKDSRIAAFVRSWLPVFGKDPTVTPFYKYTREWPEWETIFQ
ncbi:Hypothetical_protein [Hexamita inflata]|uniref:Hypothetical_protein n=1 Tax=Hexamita inflata TaxID=28002 RepID=A0AA86P9A7_9EUKA|nr:Hypothetical protein HINF_LOCUS22234 [Hexamita inflata]